MSDQIENDLDTILRKYALQNAIKYNGVANSKAVLGKVLAGHSDLRAEVKRTHERLDKIIKEVNSQSVESQKKALLNLAPELLEEKKEEGKDRELPALENVGDLVVMRFAPGPSGPLHIGHARAAILNDEYCKRYDGKLILRLEDTNPAKLMPEAYEMIRDDLDWLGVKTHEVVIQSDRFDIYYDHAKQLLKKGFAYICLCDVEDWRAKKTKGISCEDRDITPEEHLDRWEKLLDGSYSEGEAIYIVKTDLNHPNPAVRDFIGFRIIDEPPHPRTGDKYRLYPLMNFSVAVDDHLLGLTHVLRGKDHLNNTYRQGYIFDYFRWPKPEYIHYGWVSIEDTILKTSDITEKISSGEINNWTDVRLGTFKALSARGIQPEAIRRYWLDVGTKEVDVKFSWDTLYSFNRDLIDRKSPRYFFVPKPVLISLTGISELEGHAPLHPDIPEFGVRKVKLISENDFPIPIYIAEEDWQKLRSESIFRLKDLCNVSPRGENLLEFRGNDISILRKKGLKIVQWVSGQIYLKVKMILPNGEIIPGVGEEGLVNANGQIIQFERVGFAKIYDINSFASITQIEKDSIEGDLIALFSHK